MNKTTLITAVATAYTTAAATSFAFGFMLAPKQALVDDLRLPAYTDQSAISGNGPTMGGTNGAAAINQTSGFVNRQANSAAIAVDSQQAR